MRQLFLKIFLLFILTGINNSFAKNTAFLKIGPTFSTFTNVNNSKFKVGYSVGLEKDLCILHDFYIVSGVHYNSRGGVLKNVTYGYGSEIFPVTKGDIHAFQYYVSIPLLVQYTRQIHEKLFFNIFIGPSIEIALGDESFYKDEELIYDPSIHSRDEFNRPEFYPTDDFFWRHGWTKNIGIGIEFSYFILDYYYSYGLSIKSAAGYDIYKPIHSHFIRLGVIL